MRSKRLREEGEALASAPQCFLQCCTSIDIIKRTANLIKIEVAGERMPRSAQG
jgi:hypothetical protein